MSDMRQKLLPVFLDEAERKLAQLEDFFAADADAEQSLEALEAAFRAAHTLKGTAALVQAESVCSLSARMEGLLEGHFEKQCFPSAVEAEAMRLALANLRLMVGAIEKGEAEPQGKAAEAELALKLAAAMPGNRPLAELLGQKVQEDPFGDDPLAEEYEPPVASSVDTAAVEDPFAEDPVLEVAEAQPVGDTDPFAEDPDPLVEPAASHHAPVLEAASTGQDSVPELSSDSEAQSIDDPFSEDPELALSPEPVPESETQTLAIDPFADDPDLDGFDSEPGAQTDPFAEDPEPESDATGPATVEEELPVTSAISDPFAEDPGLEIEEPASPTEPVSATAPLQEAPTGQVLPGQESFAERLRRRLEQENPLGTAERLASTLLTQRSTDVEQKSYACCCFQVAGKSYYLPIANMVEIADLPGVIRLPLAPPVVRGLINLRGQVMPLIDLGVIAKEAVPYVAVRKLVIAEEGGERLAFLADGIPNLSETVAGEMVDVGRFIEQFRAGAS